MKNNADIYKRVVEWSLGDDVGLSSADIVRTALKLDSINDREPHYPKDPSDFGRCYRLLNKFPEFMPALEELAEKSHVWKHMFHNWGRMTDIYLRDVETGASAQLYSLMQMYEKMGVADKFGSEYTFLKENTMISEIGEDFGHHAFRAIKKKIPEFTSAYESFGGPEKSVAYITHKIKNPVRDEDGDIIQSIGSAKHNGTNWAITAVKMPAVVAVAGNELTLKNAFDIERRPIIEDQELTSKSKMKIGG